MEQCFQQWKNFELTNIDFLLHCIIELDGKIKISLALIIDEETYLIEGGGNEGRYSVVCEKNGEINNLINKNNIYKKG